MQFSQGFLIEVILDYLGWTLNPMKSVPMRQKGDTDPGEGHRLE